MSNMEMIQETASGLVAELRCQPREEEPTAQQQHLGLDPWSKAEIPLVK